MFKLSIILTVSAACSAYCSMPSACCQQDGWNSYLDAANDMISKAKHNIGACNGFLRGRVLKPVDCAEILLMGHNKSGVYEIWPMNRMTEGKPLSVYCDMDTAGGGWTVIQRRGDYKRPIDYFFKDWKSYKDGFGDIEKDFWLGNDNIYVLTNQKHYSARFDLKDVKQNKSYELYDEFWIENESQKYTLHISDYSGNAGDSMYAHNNKKFSTKDQKNDKRTDNFSCALLYKGGWWYASCHSANLNGLYYKGKHESYADGINWKTFRGYYDSLEETEIKIRPKNFQLLPSQ